MKEWWDGLNSREKMLIAIGAGSIFLWILYELLWSPMLSIVNTRRDALIEKARVLQSLLDARVRIQNLQGLGFKAPGKFREPLLVLTERSLQKKNLSGHVKSLRQEQDNQIELVLESIVFDNMAKWLQELWQNDGIIVQSAVINASESSGVVNVKLVLSFQHSVKGH